MEAAKTRERVLETMVGKSVNPMDKGASWATVHRVAESDTTEQLTLYFLHQTVYKICP